MPSNFLHSYLTYQFQRAMTELLDSIYQIGEKMSIALAEDNLEDFYILLGDRQNAIQQLSDTAEKKADSPDIAERFSQLEKQFNTIMRSLRAKEQAMLQDLNNLQNLKTAKRSYSYDRQPYRFLRNNVVG